MGSILLALQSRYIAISFTAASISIVYVYISDRVKRASFIESNYFRLGSLKFFTSALSMSLQQKNQWRMDFML